LDGNEKALAFQRVAVVVAHPDDEILWCGGLLLAHPEWSTFVAVLCRGSDADRAPRLTRVLERLGAKGAIGDLDDGPEQRSLATGKVAAAILDLLPGTDFDLILTHSPRGEYTRHRRHEEVARAVWSLWTQGLLSTRALWLFAYEDGGQAYLPRPEGDADLRLALPDAVWAEKRRLITDVYNYGVDTWEARTTPHEEAFHRFTTPEAATKLFERYGPT
jgi:LmbE family N-acetylglucosaminyl deacetylase